MGQYICPRCNRLASRGSFAEQQQLCRRCDSWKLAEAESRVPWYRRPVPNRLRLLIIFGPIVVLWVLANGVHGNRDQSDSRPLHERLARHDGQYDAIAPNRFRYLLSEISRASGEPPGRIATVVRIRHRRLRDEYGRDVSIERLLEAIRAVYDAGYGSSGLDLIADEVMRKAGD